MKFSFTMFTSLKVACHDHVHQQFYKLLLLAIVGCVLFHVEVAALKSDALHEIFTALFGKRLGVEICWVLLGRDAADVVEPLFSHRTLRPQKPRRKMFCFPRPQT